MIEYNYKTHRIVFRTRNYSMAGVSPTGFESKTFESIITDLNEDATLPENYGDKFPVTPDSAFGVLANIFGGALKDQWDLSGSTVNQQNRDKAVGKYLNDLAALVGLTRLLEKGSTGLLLFTGVQGTTIPLLTPVKNTNNDKVLTKSVLTLNRSLCYNSTFHIPAVVTGDIYSVVLEGDLFSHTSTVTDTPETVIASLLAAIGTQVRYTATSPDTTSILVQYNTPNNVLTTTNTDNITLVSVGSLVTSESAETGEVLLVANSLTGLVQSITGITSVTNPEEFKLGRLEELDSELRQRMADREQNTGTATIPAIQASLTNISGVVSSYAVENDTMSIDAEGRPAKSYEVYVEGGTDSSIAEVVWTTKPAGMESHGNTTIIVVDSNGDEKSVKFSRFDNKYAWVRVTYTINSEEEFPANGEDLIKNAVLVTGNKMYRGEDLEPTKFYGNIYSSVAGVYVSAVEVAVTDLPTDTPTYSNSRVAVPTTTELLFDITRVPV